MKKSGKNEFREERKGKIEGERKYLINYLLKMKNYEISRIDLVPVQSLVQKFWVKQKKIRI